MKKTFIGKLVDDSYDDDRMVEDLKEEGSAELEKEASPKKKKIFSKFNKSKKDIEDTQEIPPLDEDMIKKQRTAKRKKHLIIGLLIVLAIFVLYNLSKKSYKIDKLYNEYARAIDERNFDYLNSIVEVEGMNVAMEDYKTTFALLDDDFEFENQLKTYVKEDVEKIKKDPSYVSDRNVRVVKAKNRWIFLPGYKVAWTPITLTNKDGGELEVESSTDKLKLESGESKKFIFGRYNTTYQSSDLMVKDKIDLKDLTKKDYNYYFNGNGEIANGKVDLKKGEKVVHINTNDPNAIVFVNGKNTSLTVDEFNEMGKFDIDENSEIFLLARPQWGYVTSKSESTKGKDSLDLNINYMNGNIQRQVISLLKKTFKEDEKALATNDISNYTSLSSEAYHREEANLSLNEGYGRLVSRKYDSFKVDRNLEVDSESESEFKVEVFANFREAKYGIDEEKPADEDLEKAENVPYSFTISYDYDEKEYYITNWEKSYGQPSDDMIEVKMN
ncbi:MAG: hypothetical protein SPI59_00495 [Finegoldia sp.]|nr:hypothetical protein [Finegoldia sp.]